MPVDVEIEFKSPVRQEDLNELCNQLNRQRSGFTNASVKAKATFPEDMLGSLPENVIKFIVEGSSSVGLQQFYQLLWEPHIAPLILKVISKKHKIRRPAAAANDKSSPELTVYLTNGRSKSCFTVGVEGKKQVYDNITYPVSQPKAFAILIGCSEYNHGLNAIPPVKGNLEDMYSLLTDKKYIGLPAENVFVSFNETSDAVKHLLFTKSRAEMDTLIIYYAGHGYRVGANELYLTAINSKKLSDTHFLGVIEYDFIRKTILEESHARQKILLLDACHSGLATQSSEDDIYEVAGTYVLASSHGNEASYFNPSERNTHFTGTVIDILKTGIDFTKQTISLEDIYERSQQMLSEKKFPQPIRYKDLSIPAENYFIAPNPAFSFAKLKETIKDHFVDGDPEDVFYELESLTRQYPDDKEFQEMKYSIAADTLYTKLAQEGNEFFYTLKNYTAAAERYEKALRIKNIDPGMKNNLKICNEKLLSDQAPPEEIVNSEPEPENMEIDKIEDDTTDEAGEVLVKKRNSFSVLIPILLFIIIAGSATAIFYPRSSSFNATIQFKSNNTVLLASGLVGVQAFDKKGKKVLKGPAVLNAGLATFEELPQYFRNDTVELLLLGDLADKYEIDSSSSRLLLRTDTVQVVVKSKKDPPANTKDTADPSGKEDITPRKKIARTSLQQISSQLENAAFEDLETNKKLVLYGINNSTGSFQGRLCGYNISGKLKLDNNTFIVTSGNVTGSFAITNDYSNLTGNFLIESITPCRLNLARVQKQ